MPLSPLPVPRPDGSSRPTPRRARRRRRWGLAAALLAAATVLADEAGAQVRTAYPEPVQGFGVVPSTGVLSRGVSPADTVPTFAPFLSTVSLLPGYVTGLPESREVAGARPAPTENLSVEAYLARQRSRQQELAWEQAKIARILGEVPLAGDTTGQLASALRLPDEITSLLGAGSALDVNGRLRVSFGGGKTILEPDLRPPGFPGNDLSLELDQLLELDIRGTIGRKVNLAVDFNSEREFQNKNILSAFYQGDEDEILRRIDVGDISVSLPPSRFISVGATKGAFGLQGVGQLGPVSFRGIASRKEGETTQRSLTITPRAQGVVETVTVPLKDTQYQNSRFFLLFHPDSLAGRRIEFPNQGTQLANPGARPQGETLNVWRDNGNPTDDLATNAKFGTAFVDPNAPAQRADEARQGFFNLLVEGQDYYVVDDLILTMDRPLNANEVLAVSYVTADGDTVGSPQVADTLELKLVKTVNPDSLDFTFDYTLRNVYPLRGTEVQLQELTIYRGDQQLRVDAQRVDGELLKFTQILGVADASERPLNQRVGKDPFGGPDFLVFPDVQPFFRPVTAIGDTLPLEVPNRGLYRIPPEQRLSATQDQVYFINATYRGQAGQTNEVELGALNVLEGSETLTIGGVPLVRGEDYQIFYDFGRVVFSNPDDLFARFPNAQVEISFEVAPLFNLAPTTIAGFNTVYERGDNFFLNSTLIMQETESLSNRPILGAEPTRSILGEIDGNWELEAPFLTRALDDLPFLRAAGPSTLRLRGEAALNAPNPNTEDRVYLNDFEGVELASTISLNNRTYLFGSPPGGRGFTPLDARRLEFNTFAVPISDVTTEQVVGTRAVVEVLTVDVGNPVGAGVIAENSWRSITHRVSVQGADFSRQEALEFFVQGNQGTLLVDLGLVDEDGVRFDRSGAPVGIGELDSEDRNRDNQLDADEDTGLDGVSGADTQLVPGDVGNDDFDQAANPQGTEENDVLDTEDLNLNGVLDRREDVVRWEIDLRDPLDPHVVPGSLNDNGFRKVRLPLQRPDEVVGSGDLRRVQSLRLTFLDFGPDVGARDVQLAQLEVVGSTFLERGVVDSLGVPLAGDRSDSLAVSQVNTLENPDYESPPGVRPQSERADEIIRTGLQPLKEQSLVLLYRDLPASAEGRIYQPLNDRESYMDYSRMEIFTNGQRQLGAAGQPISDGGRLPTFFVEFGLDTLNVYRFQAPLLFDEWQEHVIEFEVLRALKTELLRRLADTGRRTGEITSEDGRYRVVIRDDGTPPPSLSQVSQLTIGVLNDAGEEIREGSFWVDDWRLTGPVTEGGGAQYVSASARLADVATVDVQLENRSARFRNLAAQMNNQDSRDFDVRTSFQLGQVLPAGLGLDMPLTVDHYSASDRPLFVVGADVEVADEPELRARQTIGNDQTVATLSLRRRQRSRNPILRATLDRTTARFTLRDQGFSSLDADRDNRAWDLTLRYDTDFARRPIGLPFEVFEKLPLPGFVKESKAFRSFVNLDVNLLPSRLALTGTALNGENVLLKRQGFFSAFAAADDIEEVETADSTRTLTGDANLTLQPTNSLRANLALSTTRDLNFPRRDGVELDRSALPGVEALRTQRFDLQWSPPVTDWLVPRYNYNASFGLNHTREVSGILQDQNLFDFSNQVAKGWTVELNLPVLLDRALGEEPRPGAPGVPAGAPPAGGFDLRSLLQPIRFESSKRQTSAFRQVPFDAPARYTFGLEDPRDEDLFPDDAQNFTEIDRLLLATGISPLRTLQIQGGYERNDNRREFFGGETRERQIVWPDVSMRWQAQNLPGVLGGLVRTLAVSSDYEDEDGDTETRGILSSEYSRSRWAPLVAVDVTWMGGLITNFRAQQSTNEIVAFRGSAEGGVREDNRRTEVADELELTMNYLFRPGTRVYLPIPFLMGDRIKGPLRTSLTLARRLREDVTSATTANPAGAGTFNVNTAIYEVRPALAYDLPRLSSGLALSYLLRDDLKRDVKTTTYSVEVFVDLTF